MRHFSPPVCVNYMAALPMTPTLSPASLYNLCAVCMQPFSGRFGPPCRRSHASPSIYQSIHTHHHTASQPRPPFLVATPDKALHKPIVFCADRLHPAPAFYRSCKRSPGAYRRVDTCRRSKCWCCGSPASGSVYRNRSDAAASQEQSPPRTPLLPNVSG